MQLISTNFVILWVISFALYYLVPKKRQWIILAVASGLFYVAGTGGIPVGIVLTGAGAYGCGEYLKRSLEAQRHGLLHEVYGCDPARFTKAGTGHTPE